MAGDALGLLRWEMLNSNNLDIRKRFFLQRMLGCWNRLPRHWSWPQPCQSSRNFWITISGIWWGCWGDLCSTRNWTWSFQLRMFCDFHGTARQTSQYAKACLEELVQMIYLLHLHALQKLAGRMSLPLFTLPCAALFQREWPAATLGTTEVVVCCWHPEGLWHSYLLLLDRILMSLDLAVLLPPTHPFFLLQGCCLDRSQGIVLFVLRFPDWWYSFLWLNILSLSYV